MTAVYLYTFGSILLVSLISFAGLFTLSLSAKTLKRYIYLLVSLAVGALLGDAFIHLIPESFEALGNPTTPSLLIIGGILVFFIFEKALHWHHHACGETDTETIHPTGKMILVSDGVHNFIDGIIIAASYMVSIEIGIATTIAVLLHEIPQEIGDFGVLIHAGYSKAKALLFNFFSALTALLGAMVAFIAAGFGETLSLWLLPVAAGGFIYVAMSDLVPELHKTTHRGYSALQLGAILVGIAAMLLLLTLE